MSNEQENPVQNSKTKIATMVAVLATSIAATAGVTHSLSKPAPMLAGAPTPPTFTFSRGRVCIEPDGKTEIVARRRDAVTEVEVAPHTIYVSPDGKEMTAKPTGKKSDAPPTFVAETAKMQAEAQNLFDTAQSAGLFKF